MSYRTVRASFQSVAERQDTYKFNYEWEVASFYRQNPQQQDRVHFISVGRVWAKSVGGAKAYDTNQDAFMRGTVQRTRDVFGACAARGMNPKDIFIYMAEPFRRPGLPQLLGPSAPIDILCAYVFDHELGHALTKEGIGHFNLSECAADAYAILRHFQRFGMKSGRLENIGDLRAIEMVFRNEWGGNHGNHFSTPVVDAVLRDSKSTDFSRLTPDETIHLADCYALTYAAHPQLVKRTVQNFARFRGTLSDMMLGDYSALAVLGQQVLSTPSPVEFKWGSRALMAVLDGQVCCDGVVLSPCGDEWQKLRQSVKARHDHFRLKGPSFLGLCPLPANNNGGV